MVGRSQTRNKSDMTPDQKERIKEGMEAYLYYEANGISVYKTPMIDAAQKVKKELGMSNISVCKGCLDEIHTYMAEIYKIYENS